MAGDSSSPANATSSYDTTVSETNPSKRKAPGGRPETMLGLTVVWAREEPELLGQVAVISGSSGALVGRQGEPNNPVPRLLFARQRPGHFDPGDGFRNVKISREQLMVEPMGPGRLRVRNVGRCPLVDQSRPVEMLEVGPGDLIQLGHQAMFLVGERPVVWPPLAVHPQHVFGAPDRFGIVGESPAAWELRRAIAFAATHEAHVLITGPSGTGKELVAHAIHGTSSRASLPLVARNAATFPEGLIDAELFGNIRNYPNPGMADRPGLIGQANGSTLFLDEMGELPEALQSHLLRVLDSGEYQRLGESGPRQSRFRLVAATNRSLESLKHDLAARLPLRIAAPGLEERREDIPLIANALLSRMMRGQPSPPLSLALTRFLITHPYATHVRELEALLWSSLARWSGTGDLGLPSVAPAPPAEEGSDEDDPSDATPPVALDAATIQRCLDEHSGRIEAAWRALGLSSRHVLVRLIAKHNLLAGTRWRPS